MDFKERGYAPFLILGIAFPLERLDIIIKIMIYSLNGRLMKRGENDFVLENNGVGFRIAANQETLAGLPAVGQETKIFCYTYIRDTQIEIYGFLNEESLKFFELLNTVSGVGPKTALGILNAGPVENLMASIVEKKAEFLTRSSGIGRKTAERIILDLQSKIKLPKTAKGLTDSMAIDEEVENALVGLGYGRNEIKQLLRKLPSDSANFVDRLKQVLKNASRS